MNPGFYPDEFNVATMDGRNFRLLNTIFYQTRAGEQINIFPGSESDGASTPPSTWLITPPFGWYWRAAFLHDFLYRRTQRPKNECDALLLEAMEVLLDQMEKESFGKLFQRGLREIEARAFYEAVALGGGCSFDADRAAQKTGGFTK